jgi:hypothetical protein
MFTDISDPASRDPSNLSNKRLPTFPVRKALAATLNASATPSASPPSAVVRQQLMRCSSDYGAALVVQSTVALQAACSLHDTQRTLRWAWLRTMPAQDHISALSRARFSATQAADAAPSRCGTLPLDRPAAYSSA